MPVVLSSIEMDSFLHPDPSKIDFKRHAIYLFIKLMPEIDKHYSLSLLSVRQFFL